MLLDYQNGASSSYFEISKVSVMPRLLELSFVTRSFLRFPSNGANKQKFDIIYKRTSWFNLKAATKYIDLFSYSKYTISYIDRIRSGPAHLVYILCLSINMQTRINRK